MDRKGNCLDHFMRRLHFKHSNETEVDALRQSNPLIRKIKLTFRSLLRQFLHLIAILVALQFPIETRNGLFARTYGLLVDLELRLSCRVASTTS